MKERHVLQEWVDDGAGWSVSGGGNGTKSNPVSLDESEMRCTIADNMMTVKTKRRFVSFDITKTFAIEEYSNGLIIITSSQKEFRVTHGMSNSAKAVDFIYDMIQNYKKQSMTIKDS